MSDTSKRSGSLDDILNLPEGITGEIIAGELYTQPRPSAGNAFVETMLSSRLPTVPNTPSLTIAPNWICEILSPSTRRKDRMVKLPSYLGHGVEWAWMVDPLLREIEVFESAGGHWALRGSYGDVDKARIPPFEATELDLAAIWPPAAESI
jgi:Uma2 family endonuclease